MRLYKCIVFFGFSAAILIPELSADISLVDRNPFVWPGFSPGQTGISQTTQPSNQGFEFHAVYELAGETQVLVMDRATNKYHWLKVGREVDGLYPKSYNPESNQLVFAYENSEQSLELKEKPDVTVAPLASGAQPVQRATQSPGGSIQRNIVTPRRTITRRPTPTVNTGATGAATLSGSSISPTGSAIVRPPVRRSRGPVTGDLGMEAPSFTPASPGPPPSSAPPQDVPPPAPSDSPTMQP